MKKRTVAIATAAAACAMSLTTAEPASADLTTRCVGEGGAVTVPSDLVVPRGRSCTLTGTKVLGDVRVAKGADLIANDVSVEGRVRVAEDAYFDTTGTSVDGPVRMRSSYGAHFDASAFGSRVNARPNANTDHGGFVFALESEVSGNVVARKSELFLEDSEIGGTVKSRGSLYTDVYGSFIDGRLLVRDNRLGSMVCAAVVQGSSRFVGNGEVVQLGSDGPVANCAGASYWGGNVTVNDSTGGVYVDHNIVNGNLTLRRNDPVAQLGDSNRVRGKVRGEYEDMTSAKKPQLRSMAPNSATQRDERLTEKAAKRRSAAVKSADRAGAANIGR